MAQHSTYNAADVSATLDGVAVLAPADGDFIVVSEGSGAGTGLVGVSGDSIFSASNDRSATITIRLLHTSPTHRRLEQKLSRQREGSAYKPFSFAFRDIGSGEGATAEKCHIMTAPDISKGNEASAREWVLWTGELRRLIPNEVA